MNLSQGSAGLVHAFEVSPDGRNLILVSTIHDHEQLFHSGLTLSNLAPISADSLDVRLAHYAPNGSQIVYLAHPQHSSEDVWDLLLFDLRLGTTRVLASHRVIHRLSWSADGSQLYLEVGVNRRNIQVFDVVSGQEYPLQTSLDEVNEQTHAVAHRWKGNVGLLYESKNAAGSTIQWAPQDTTGRPLQPVEMDSHGVWLP